MSEIPAEIMKKIRERAAEEWPGNTDMQEDMIAEEAAGYLEFSQADFATALIFKDKIIREAKEYYHAWKDRARHVRDEIAAFVELRALAPDDVPAGVVNDIKAKTAAEIDWYWSQLEEVKRRVQNYRAIQQTRAKVEPIRELLTRMEKIIGGSCYNGNIQNYAGRGVPDFPGRQIRYPVTFPMPDGTEVKRSDQPDDLAPETLIEGHYKFGANEIKIYRALEQIVDMLQKDYGLQLPAPN